MRYEWERVLEAIVQPNADMIGEGCHGEVHLCDLDILDGSASMRVAIKMFHQLQEENRHGGDTYRRQVPIDEAFEFEVLNLTCALTHMFLPETPVLIPCVSSQIDIANMVPPHAHIVRLIGWSKRPDGRQFCLVYKAERYALEHWMNCCVGVFTVRRCNRSEGLIFESFSQDDHMAHPQARNAE